jgi:ribonuclease BN (tRNA processing enzyme)
MELTVLGSGTAVPEPDRVCSGYLLDTGDARLLFDCGPGVVHSMARLAVDWQGITHLIITHFHNDHTGDVPMLFFAWKHGMRPARSEPLTVIGPAGTSGVLKRMGAAFGSHVNETDFAVHVEEIGSAGELRLSDTALLSARRSHHTEQSLAYRVDAASRSFCYTGDTGLSNDVARLAQAVDLLLIECSLPDELAMETHLTPDGVAAMARSALPRRLLLTHIYPQLDRARLPELVRLGGWPARVEIAADGDRIRI